MNFFSKSKAFNYISSTLINNGIAFAYEIDVRYIKNDKLKKVFNKKARKSLLFAECELYVDIFSDGTHKYRLYTNTDCDIDEMNVNDYLTKKELQTVLKISKKKKKEYQIKIQTISENIHRKISA